MNQNVLAHTLVTVVPRKIFRAYDIRGNLSLLTPDLVKDIGFALANSYLQAGQKQVVVGYDARLSSEHYAQILTEALASSGLYVIHIGCVSSPLLYFVASLYEGNGVMLTASHNSVSDNGIKWLTKFMPPTPEHIQHIADDIEQRPLPYQMVKMTQKGQIQYQDFSQTYLDYLQQDIQLNTKFKVSVDGFHGSAGTIARQALTHLGCDVDALHCERNGHFPLGAPDPSIPERLVALRQSVLQQQSVMGIALDGDGDRLVILDEKGQHVSPDRLISLFAKICLTQQPGSEIVCDVKCSTLIAQTAQQYRGRCSMIRTGSSFLRNYLYAHHAIFGGEFAGHYVFNDGRGKGFDDGLYAALRILEYLDQQQQPLSVVLAEFPERVATNDVYIQCHGIDYIHILNCIEQKTGLEGVSLSKVDGIRLDFPFGFGIIRPSNTGEYFTVRFDADHTQHLEQIRHVFVNALQQDFPQIAQAIETYCIHLD